MTPPPPDDLDAAVRRALDADAAAVDAARLWANVESRLRAEPPPEPASPAERVAAARDAAGPADRLTLDPPPRLAERFPALAAVAGRPRTVHTRGDRFVVRPGVGDGGAFGRDADGRVWVAPSPAAAARFAPGQTPPGLRPVAGVCELDVRKLLNEVLADFDLTASPDGVSAVRRGPAGPFRPTRAELRIDPATKAVRDFRLTRELPTGEPVGVRFEYLSAEPTPDGDCEAAGHLDPAAPVYDADRPLLRLRLLRRAFGEAAAGEP